MHNPAMHGTNIKFSDKICTENQNRKSCRLCDNLEKYGTARQATDYHIAHCYMIYIFNCNWVDTR
jgi:hypothetical protein